MQASSLECFVQAERRLTGERRAQRGSDRHAITRAERSRDRYRRIAGLAAAG
jgi:hypothetical protein